MTNSRRPAASASAILLHTFSRTTAFSSKNLCFISALSRHFRSTDFLNSAEDRDAAGRAMVRQEPQSKRGGDRNYSRRRKHPRPTPSWRRGGSGACTECRKRDTDWVF